MICMCVYMKAYMKHMKCVYVCMYEGFMICVYVCIYEGLNEMYDMRVLNITSIHSSLVYYIHVCVYYIHVCVYM
jgi:hypothetical protein